jgi:hypothetical protein
VPVAGGVEYASGMPEPSTIRWCFAPSLPQLTGLGLVVAPPFSVHVAGVDAGWSGAKWDRISLFRPSSRRSTHLRSAQAAGYYLKALYSNR